MANVAVFWDYENTRVPVDTTPQAATECIRRVALTHGSLQSVRVYFDSAYEQGTSNSLARSQLQMSGFSLIDTPHAGSKDVADVQLISDMVVWAVEQGRGSTVILISGDKDFSYPLSLLRNRSINVVLMSAGTAPEGLRASATSALIWRSVLGLPEKPPPREKTTLLTSRPLYDRPVRILPRTSRAAPSGYSSAPAAPSLLLRIAGPPIPTRDQRRSDPPRQPQQSQQIQYSHDRPAPAPAPAAPAAERQYLHWTPYASPLRRPTLDNSKPLPDAAIIPFRIEPVASGSNTRLRSTDNSKPLPVTAIVPFRIEPVASGSNSRFRATFNPISPPNNLFSNVPTGPKAMSDTPTGPPPQRKREQAAQRIALRAGQPLPTTPLPSARQGPASRTRGQLGAKDQSTPTRPSSLGKGASRATLQRAKLRERQKERARDAKEAKKVVETIVISDSEDEDEGEDEEVEKSLVLPEAIRNLKRKLSEVELEEEGDVVDATEDPAALARRLAKSERRSERRARKKLRREERESEKQSEEDRVVLAAAQVRGEVLLAQIMGTAPEQFEVGMGGNESMEVIGHTSVNGLEELVDGDDELEEEVDDNVREMEELEELGSNDGESIAFGPASDEDDSFSVIDGEGEDGSSVESPPTFFEDVEGDDKLLGVENGDSEVILFDLLNDSPPHSRRKKYDDNLSDMDFGNSST